MLFVFIKILYHILNLTDVLAQFIQNFDSFFGYVDYQPFNISQNMLYIADFNWNNEQID